jgi:predicted ATPase/DNA-binding CsgD family transcriptional regulator
MVLAPDSTTSLPPEVTEFVGRRQDRGEVKRLLSESRLVTVTGFGGVGKTRLALRVASELSRVYPEGVWFVPLGDLPSPDLIADATARVLGVRRESSPFEPHHLVEYLRNRELLLVFDNCEHLIEECASLADSLLRGCPKLHILATSREALRVQGEAIWSVAPLSVPDLTSAAALQSAHDFEAVRLFVARASHAVPGFTLSDDNRREVVEICQELEGIPLGVELAAVGLRSMSPPELLQGLREHWALLGFGARGGPERHRTMSACLEWSAALCSSEERDLWAHLSVFAGGVDLEAIRYVAERVMASPSSGQVPQLVQSLVDKSIMSRDVRDSRTRYRMLDVLRQYGLKRLSATGDLTTTRRAHRDWCVDFVASAESEWMTPSQMDWIGRLRREEANLRLALEFSCTEEGEGHAGLELAARLQRVAALFGWYGECMRWLERLLPLVPEPSMSRLRGLRAACWLAVLQGDNEASAALLAAARQLAAELGVPAGLVVEDVAGLRDLIAGDAKSAIEHLDTAQRIYAKEGDLRHRAETLTVLGMAYGHAGDVERGLQSLEESLSICERTGELWNRSFTLWRLGILRLAKGQTPVATKLVKQSLELHSRMGQRVGVAACLEALAWLAAERDPERAVTLLGAARALGSAMGDPVLQLPALEPAPPDQEAELRARLGESKFAGAFADGRSMRWEAMIAYAMEQKGPVGRDVSPPSTEWSGLTKREQQVAKLVAEGLSNKDIASQLVISRRTAETHVENILTKLGFTSRTQISAWVSSRARGHREP